MSLSLTSRERLGAIMVLGISLLLTGAGWWWRTRSEARALAVTVTPLPTEVPHEAAAGHNTVRKAHRDSLSNDSAPRPKTRRTPTESRRRSGRPAPAYSPRQHLDEPVATE
ncbi:MAG: hypothetical protein K2N96_05100 [Muribaculaceae bacterium]|nr:hypothetical protein [Muribaculaceae bacterium]